VLYWAAVVGPGLVGCCTSLLYSNPRRLDRLPHCQDGTSSRSLICKLSAEMWVDLPWFPDMPRA
jgi:hypothetical protein